MIGTCAVGQPAASLPSSAGAVSTVVNPTTLWILGYPRRALSDSRGPLPNRGGSGGSGTGVFWNAKVRAAVMS